MRNVRKLGKLAAAIPAHLAQSFILLAKTDTFSTGEVRLARTVSSEYGRRVILWSRDELEPYFLYERATERLGDRRYAATLSEMANLPINSGFLSQGRDPHSSSVKFSIFSAIEGRPLLFEPRGI